MSDVIKNFQTKYPTKAAREKALKGMTDTQIDKLIDAMPSVQGKIYLSKFRSTPRPKSTKR